MGEVKIKAQERKQEVVCYVSKRIHSKEKFVLYFL